MFLWNETIELIAFYSSLYSHLKVYFLNNHIWAILECTEINFIIFFKFVYYTIRKKIYRIDYSSKSIKIMHQLLHYGLRYTILILYIPKFAKISNFLFWRLIWYGIQLEKCIFLINLGACLEILKLNIIRKIKPLSVHSIVRLNYIATLVGIVKILPIMEY